MKYTFLFIFTLFFADVSAQTKVAVKKNTKGDQPFYRTKTSELFYIGVENRFILYKDPSKKYTVTIKNGSIVSEESESKDSCIYKVTVQNSEPTFISITVDSKTYTYKFRNRKIPSPEIRILFGAQFTKDSEIPAEKFLNAKSLSLELHDFDYDVSMKIVGMQLTVIKNSTKKDYMLTDNLIEEYAKTAGSGDIYIFHDVVIEILNTKTQRIINGATYFIK